MRFGTVWKSFSHATGFPLACKRITDVISPAVADGFGGTPTQSVPAKRCAGRVAAAIQGGALFDRGLVRHFTPACVIALPLAKPSDPATTLAAVQNPG